MVVNGKYQTGEWVYGCLVIHNSRYYIYYETEDLMRQTGNWLKQVEVIPETVSRCTGLRDAKGSYIYEYDNVLNLHVFGIGAVKWDSETARFIIDFPGTLVDFDNCDSVDLELCGTKFDEPSTLNDWQKMW